MKKWMYLVAALTVIALSLFACKDKQEASGSGSGQLKFGYVLNDMSHEWYQNIAKGARARAAELGIDINIADAAMDAAKQVSQLENMLTQGVDVLIITPVDVKALPNIIAEADKAGIPVVTESNVVPGTATYVGIDNVTGGKRAGTWFAEYARANNIEPRILIVGLPAFEDCRQRVEGFKAGMDAAGLKYTILQEIDGQGSKEISLKVAQDAITAHPDVNVIFGINDNSTTGGMVAYKEAGLDESKLTAIGFGFEGVVGREALLSGGPYKAAVAMFPDYVGVSVVDAAVKAANKEPLPSHFESGTVVITQENFSQFYTKDGNDYKTNFEAIRSLMNK
jgi:ABC-type sugar transport system substrate-binding protein